ncbi:MAG: GtrA family protein [Christensenella sp.]|nr:GtrA family protein [Christensenella sp.]
MQQQKKEEIVRVVKYALFSISAGVIQFLSFTLFKEVFGLVYWLCYLSALVLSVLWNFTLNRQFTFQSAANIPRAMLLVALYYAIYTPLSSWWGNALTNLGWNWYLMTGISMLINFVTEFLYWRLVVYRDSINTNDRAKKRLAEEELQEVTLQEEPK